MLHHSDSEDIVITLPCKNTFWKLKTERTLKYNIRCSIVRKSKSYTGKGGLQIIPGWEVVVEK